MDCSIVSKYIEYGDKEMTISKEGKRKLKASLANIALFFSIFVVLFPLALPTVSAATTWYVYPGQSIQTCIDDNANAGDTVFVYAGTYVERISIPLALDHFTLEGEDRDTTTIDADHTGTVITISASWVNVTGFT